MSNPAMLDWMGAGLLLAAGVAGLSGSWTLSGTIGRRMGEVFWAVVSCGLGSADGGSEDGTDGTDGADGTNGTGAATSGLGSADGGMGRAI